jgi:hypothetical protein
MTATLEVTMPDGRQGRIFANTKPIDDAIKNAFTTSFIEEDDRSRDAALRDLVSQGALIAWAHPGVDPDDVVHVYLQPVASGDPLFACVVVSRERLERMLSESSFVMEGFSLQVVDARTLSADSAETIQAAIEAWIGRIYPSASLPVIFVMPWRDDLSITGEPIRGSAEEIVEAREPKIGDHEMPRQPKAA